MIDIDVLTPSYGYARFIGDALDSVSKQQDVRATHIVQDGASDDGTVEVLAQRTDPGLRWNSAPDEGQSDALNKALQAGTSSWVAWLNADEFYMPDALKALAAVAERGEADVLYGDAAFVDENGDLLRLLPQHRFSDYVLRYYGTFVPSCTLLVRRSFMEKAGWRSRYRMIMDWDLYLRLRVMGAKFSYVPRPIGGFRVHSSQVTAAPQSDYADEYQAIRSEYKIVHSRPSHQAGRLLHFLYKATAGGYRKQRRALAFKGRSLRWFADESTEQDVRHLISTTYGDRAE